MTDVVQIYTCTGSTINLLRDRFAYIDQLPQNDNLGTLADDKKLNSLANKKYTMLVLLH